MNIRRGIARVLIIAVILADIGVSSWIYANPSYDRSEDWLAVVVFAIGIPVAAYVGWIAVDWVIRGFHNSN